MIGPLRYLATSMGSARPSVHLRGVVAGAAFLYMLNAFVQSGYIRPLELIVGLLWVGMCLLAARWLRVWMILAIGFGASLAWSFFVESRPISDFMTFHTLAQTVAEGGGWLRALDSKSPPTVAYFAAFQAVVLGYATNYVSGAVAWTVGCLLIYRAAALHLEGVFPARLILCGLAFYPTFVVFAGVPSSEALFFLFTGAAIWSVAESVARKGYARLGFAVAAGVFIGLLYLTRMNGLILLLPCIYVILAWCRTGWRTWGIGSGLLHPTLVVAGVVLVVLAFGGLAALKGDGFRATPSQSGGLLLLFGTNKASYGGFNRLDAALAGRGSEDPSVRAGAPAKAREIALQRIRADIPGFLAFAATDKVEHLWLREHPEIVRSIGPLERRASVPPDVLITALRLSDGAYRVVFVLFLVGLVVQIVRPDRGLILGAVVLLYALPHVLIEVQPRYHLTMVPFMIAGALLCVGRLGPRLIPTMRRWIAR